MRRLTAGEIRAYDHVPSGVAARARIQPVPVLWPGTAGMTLGRLVLVRRDPGPAADGLLAHELVHVRQWQELGAARFLARYLGAYLRGRWRRHGHRAAYAAIPLEREAYQAAATWARSRR